MALYIGVTIPRFADWDLHAWNCATRRCSNDQSMIPICRDVQVGSVTGTLNVKDGTLGRWHTKNPCGGVSVESCSERSKQILVVPHHDTTTMRPFLVVLLVQSFLLLGRAMPISKELPAEALFGPAKDGFFPRGVEGKSA